MLYSSTLQPLRRRTNSSHRHAGFDAARQGSWHYYRPIATRTTTVDNASSNRSQETLDQSSRVDSRTAARPSEPQPVFDAARPSTWGDRSSRVLYTSALGEGRTTETVSEVDSSRRRVAGFSNSQERRRSAHSGPVDGHFAHSASNRFGPVSRDYRLSPHPIQPTHLNIDNLYLASIGLSSFVAQSNSSIERPQDAFVRRNPSMTSIASHSSKWTLPDYSDHASNSHALPCYQA